MENISEKQLTIFDILCEEVKITYSTDELIEKCKNCKALAYNATPPQEERK